MPVRDADLADASGDFELDVGVIYTHEQRFMMQLVDSLRGACQGLRWRLILVDNDSRESTAEWEARVPSVTVLRNHERLGYARNLNSILEAATAPLVLLLNTDVYFPDGEMCLAKMAQFMRSHPDCGLSTCRVYHPDGSYAWPARRFQNVQIALARRLGLEWPFCGSLDRYLYRDRGTSETFECDWVSGCFMLVSREAVRQVGGFDCRFGKYFEDVDMGLRMKRGGWRVMFHGGTWCYHHEQRASRRWFSGDHWRHLASYVRWIRKWGWRPGMQMHPSR